MKKILIIVLSVLVLLTAGLFILSGEDEPAPAVTDTSTDNDQIPDTTTDESDSEFKPGEYLYYTETDFAATSPNKKVIFFHADWCPDCRYFENIIENSELPDGLTIFKADYDDQVALKKKYGITYQTYLVYVDESGELIDKWSALETPTIAEVAERVGL